MLVNLADIDSEKVCDKDTIIIAKTALYSRQLLSEQFFTENGAWPSEEEIVEFAMESAECDLACDWGHICSRHDLFVLNLSNEEE